MRLSSSRTPPNSGNHVASLTRRSLEIKAVAEKIGNVPATLWLVFCGARANEGTNVRPIEAGAWAFSRVLANEFPKLDVRRIDISADLPLDLAAQRIRNIVLSGTNETELQVDKRTVRAVRVSGLRQVVESKSARDARGGAATARRHRRSARRVDADGAQAACGWRS